MSELVGDETLENSAIVANCRMNRERELTGSNGYAVELGFNPLDRLRKATANEPAPNGPVSNAPLRWLDLCCGSARALTEAAKLAEQTGLSIEIVGVDLVDMFLPNEHSSLTLVAASLRTWSPNDPFDLITCVHGLHYIGDKLGLMGKVPTWLKSSGEFTANLDLNNIWIDGVSRPRRVAKVLRHAGFEYSTQTKRVSIGAGPRVEFPLDYVGADDAAGPNYTGQSAVNSHFQSKTTA